MTIETFIAVLAIIGCFQVARQLIGLANWWLMVDRSGNSGRDTHWLNNPRIIGGGK